MDTIFSSDDQAFREQVRAWIADNWNADLARRIADKSTFKAAQTEWQKKLQQRGWVAPGWPEEYGGPGWSATQRFIFNDEMAAAGTADPMPFGLNMVAPVIYNFGSEVQKKRFLPQILSSDEWWCQGYSEPGAGSDLASLKTKADSDGDDYIINGAKIWTSYAQYADWIFCLVRTDASGKKQQGISFILIDMQSQGIKVNPIIGLDGRHTLNEVEFNEVRVPKANLIGEAGQGWTYAKALLNHERTLIAWVGESKRKLAEIKALAKREMLSGQPLAADSLFQQRFTTIEVDFMALEFTELRVLATVAAGGAPGAESSLLKISGTELQHAIQDLYLDVAGAYAGVVDAEAVSGHGFANQARIDFMYGRAASIYGGSNEVQKNIIAKAVLGL